MTYDIFAAMKQPKENAIPKFVEMIKKSWTWGKLTEDERKTFLTELLGEKNELVIIGTYEHRYNICNSIYNMYLMALGYNGWNWRTEIDETIPF